MTKPEMNNPGIKDRYWSAREREQLNTDYLEIVRAEVAFYRNRAEFDDAPPAFEPDSDSK